MSNFEDLTGMRAGRVVVVKYLGRIKGQSMWECLCDCGKLCAKRMSHLKSGVSKSCGCYNRDIMLDKFKTHGLSKHPLRSIHNSMMARCYNPKSKAYKFYGAKGIKVCERWHLFKNFYDDMILGYEKGLSIERNVVTGHYELSNCRWATTVEQSRNRTDNVFLEYEGQKMILSDWAEKMKIRKATLSLRLKLGWSVERALSEPVKLGRR